MTLEQKIEENRKRQRRYERAERILRAVRLNYFEYEDQGKAEKATRVMLKCKAILAPLWEAQAHARSVARDNYGVGYGN